MRGGAALRRPILATMTTTEQGTPATRPQWSRLDLTDPAQAEEAFAISQQIAPRVSLGSRSLDLDWRTGGGSDRTSVHVYSWRQSGEVLGFAVFSRRERPLKFQLGELPLGRARLARFWHLGEPYLSADLSDDQKVEACRLLAGAALASLRRRECLFFEGLPTGSALHSALSDRSRLPPAVMRQLGKGYDHQFIRMPASYQEYLAQLGSRSRQSVLYSQRRLSKEVNGDLKCRCFESEEDVDTFVKDGGAVSRKTYQWNLLGLGLRDTPELRASLTHAARRGTLRSFILYCAGRPVAFMLGHQHGDCYYYDDVGYDPDYAKHSVGSVLQIQVLEYLYSRPDTPRYFDFSTGYGQHKGRFGNFARSELDMLVMPPTLENRMLLGAYAATDRFSTWTASMLDRFGIKDRLKRLIRRQSQRGAQAQ